MACLVPSSVRATVDAVSTRFNLANAAAPTPLTPGTHLPRADCTTYQEGKDEMASRHCRELVGVLVWPALRTRPDIEFATSSLAALVTVTIRVEAVGRPRNAFFAASKEPRDGGSGLVASSC